MAAFLWFHWLIKSCLLFIQNCHLSDKQNSKCWEKYYYKNIATYNFLFIGKKIYLVNRYLCKYVIHFKKIQLRQDYFCGRYQSVIKMFYFSGLLFIRLGRMRLITEKVSVAQNTRSKTQIYNFRTDKLGHVPECADINETCNNILVNHCNNYY